MLQISTILLVLQAWLMTCVESSLEQEDLRQLLHVHNTFRNNMVAVPNSPLRIANMNKLEWSSTLAQRAERAVTCDSYWGPALQRLNTAYHHSFNVGKRRNDVNNVLEQIVSRWYTEQQHFFIRNETACLPYFSCNSFRNIVNAKHRYVGCAAKSDCSNNRRQYTVLVCLYEGGDSDFFNIEFGQPCSGCSQPTGFCANNALCAACDSTQSDCACRKTCRARGIGWGTLDNNTCSCTCHYGHGPNCDQPCEDPQHYVDFDYCEEESADDPTFCQNSDMREMCPKTCHVCRSAPRLSRRHLHRRR